MRLTIPRQVFLKFLATTEALPGYFGRSMGRKLKRRLLADAQVRFDTVVATLGPADTVIDFGANIGSVTARLAETGATVHAYEPDPDTFATLRANVAHLENVFLFPEAVGSQAGIMTLYRALLEMSPSEDLRAQSSSVVFIDRHSDPSNAVSVPVIAFSQAIARAGGQPRLIKMDIEGAETAILTQLLPKTMTSVDLAGLALPFGAMFVETHEGMLREHWPEVQRLRAVARELRSSEINLYWP